MNWKRGLKRLGVVLIMVGLTVQFLNVLTAAEPMINEIKAALTIAGRFLLAHWAATLLIAVGLGWAVSGLKSTPPKK